MNTVYVLALDWEKQIFEWLREERDIGGTGDKPDIRKLIMKRLIIDAQPMSCDTDVGSSTNVAAINTTCMTTIAVVIIVTIIY